MVSVGAYEANNDVDGIMKIKKVRFELHNTMYIKKKTLI